MLCQSGLATGHARAPDFERLLGFLDIMNAENLYALGSARERTGK